jgi:hypothetical protein
MAQLRVQVAQGERRCMRKVPACPSLNADCLPHHLQRSDVRIMFVGLNLAVADPSTHGTAYYCGTTVAPLQMMGAQGTCLPFTERRLSSPSSATERLWFRNSKLCHGLTGPPWGRQSAFSEGQAGTLRMQRRSPCATCTLAIACAQTSMRRGQQRRGRIYRVSKFVSSRQTIPTAPKVQHFIST